MPSKTPVIKDTSKNNLTLERASKRKITRDGSKIASQEEFHKYRKSATELQTSQSEEPAEKKQRRSLRNSSLVVHSSKNTLAQPNRISKSMTKITKNLARKSSRLIEKYKDISIITIDSDSSNEEVDKNSLSANSVRKRASKLVDQQLSDESDFEVSKRKLENVSKSSVYKSSKAVTSVTPQKTIPKITGRITRQNAPITPTSVETSTPRTRSKTIPIQFPKENSIRIDSPKAQMAKKLTKGTSKKAKIETNEFHLNSKSHIIISEYKKIEILMKSLGLPNELTLALNKPPKCPVPCRENQFKNIFEFLISNIENNQSGCIYVSGVPGTGKTLICKSVVKILQENKNTSFDHAYINGLSLSTPDKVWKQLYKAINGKNEKPISCQKALLRLDAHFKSSKKKKPFILIIDELDQLIEKNQKLLYNLFEWCDHDRSLFSLVSIFNTINLPEYFAARNISRMGLSRTTFAPYNSKELEEIISLEDYAKDLNSDAKKLISRKVSSISGDVRRAKELARRAAEIVKTKELSDIKAVDDAFKEIFSSPKVDAIKDCSRLEQNFLRELSNDLEKNGLEVTTLKVVATNLIKNAPLEGMSIVLDDVIRAFKSLMSLSLIGAENTNFLEKKIRLNVSPEDIKFALDNE